MIFNFSSKIVYYLLLIFPVSYSLGPAIPDIIITLTSLLYLINIFLLKKYRDDKILTYLIIIFWIYLVLSSFWSPNFIKSITSSLAFIRFLILPFAVNFFISEKTVFVLHLSKIIFFYLIFLGIDIIYQNFFGIDFFGFESKFEGVRNSGFFGDELIAGSFISKFFLIAFFLFNKKNLFLKKNLFILFISFVILLTGERMAFVNFSLIIILYLILTESLKKNLVILFSLLILITSSLLLFEKNKNRMVDDVLKIVFQGTYDIHGKYSDYLYDQEGNILRKKYIILDSGWGAHWLTAYNIFKENPIFGKGIRSFRFICDQEKYKTISAADRSRCTTHPHNFYMEILSELGLFGLLLLILFFLRVLFLNYLIIIKEKYDYNFLVIFAVSISPIAVTGSFFSNSFATMFWYLASLALIKNKNKL